MSLEFRNYVTLLIVGLLIGGAGVAIVSDAWLPRTHDYTRLVDGSEVWTYTSPKSLEDSACLKSG